MAKIKSVIQLDNVHPSKKALADFAASGFLPIGRSFVPSDSYSKHAPDNALTLAILDARLDVFEALVSQTHVGLKTGLNIDFLPNMDDPNNDVRTHGLHYSRLYGTDTPEKHDAFTVPAISFLLAGNLCPKSGFKMLVTGAIEKNDFPMMQIMLKHIKDTSSKTLKNYNFGQHYNALIEHERIDWIKLFAEQGVEPTVKNLEKSLSATDPEYVRKMIYALDTLFQHMRPEEINEMMFYVSTPDLACALTMKDVDPAWKKDGQFAAQYLFSKGKQDVVDYLLGLGRFSNVRDVLTLDLALTDPENGGAAKLLNVLLDGDMTITMGKFANLARLADCKTPQAFFDSLPEKIRQKEGLIHIKIELDQNAAARNANLQTLHAAAEEQRAATEREGRNG